MLPGFLMCRLLGIVSSEHTRFRFYLHEAPRSLGTLSQHHPHGWGVAVHAPLAGWALRKKAMCAREDAEFVDVAGESGGHVLLAHVRKRTVGPIGLPNTHPFRRGRWVFAHNGTIDDGEFLRDGTSAARRAEVEGDTDSERLFAFLLTHLDDAGVADAPADARTDAAVRRATRAALARPSLGSSNFLLSDGDALYAFRSGRPLFLLERLPGDHVRPERRSAETGAVLETTWSARRHAVIVASEQLTDEPWRSLDEGALVRLSHAGGVKCETIAAGE
jgi:glutamine amidotransferase